MKNLTVVVAREMQIHADVRPDGSVIFRKGHFEITPQGAIWEEYNALDTYITETGDPSVGLDAYMRDTEIVHNFAEIAKVIGKQTA